MIIRLTIPRASGRHHEDVEVTVEPELPSARRCGPPPSPVNGHDMDSGNLDSDAAPARSRGGDQRGRTRASAAGRPRPRRAGPPRTGAGG